MFKWLPDQIRQIEAISKKHSLDWKFQLNPPAAPDDILLCERELGLSLPPSYHEFLLKWNGAHLFYSNETILPDGDIWRHGGAKITILDTDDVPDYNQENRLDFDEEEWNSLILFCEYGGCGDSCGLDPQQKTDLEYAVLDCFHELYPRSWRQTIIASSFEDWMKQIFNYVYQEKHPYFWMGIEDLNV